MSTTHLPRIEREAKTTYANLSNPRDRTMFISGYITGGRAELNRAAPVVKALEELIRHAKYCQTHHGIIADATIEYGELIHKTYKNDNA